MVNTFVPLVQNNNFLLMQSCKCGSVNFHVIESTIWNAHVNKTSGTLECSLGESEIEKVICKGCNAEYTQDDFSEVAFN